MRVDGTGIQLESERLSEQVIGAAIEVHKHLGPGLLESAYEHCLCHELQRRGLKHQRQVVLPVVYKGERIDCGYRMDIVVESTLLIEVKSVESVLPVHEAQLLTYLQLSHLPVGLLLNFNVILMRDGLVRRALSKSPLRDFRALRGESSSLP